MVAAVAVALVAAGVVVIAHALDAIDPIRSQVAGGGLATTLDLTDFPLRRRWAWAGGGLALVMLGLLLAVLAVAQTERARDRSARVRLGGASRNGLYQTGQVTVGMASLHALVAHAAERDPSVREADPVLKLGRRGWHLACRLSVVPDAAIPDLIARLKTTLPAALERHTGLPVVRTDLDVQVFALDARTRVH